MAQTFNGTSSLAVLSALDKYNFKDTTFTLAAKFKTTTTATGTIVAKGCGGSSYAPGWGLFINSAVTGKVRMMFKIGTSNGVLAMDRYSVSATLNDGAWHSVIITATTDSTTQVNNTMAVNIDGVDEAGTLTVTGKYVSSSTQNMCAGVRVHPASPSNYFAGDVADIAFWNGVLTLGEKQAYARGINPRRIRPSTLIDVFPLVRNFNSVTGSSATPTALVVTRHPKTFR